MRRKHSGPKPEHLSDPDLADRARKGDAAAFRELHKRHAQLAARFATAVAGPGHNVGDATTRGFLRALTASARRYPEPDIPFKLQLLSATRSTARQTNDVPMRSGPRGWNPAIPAEVIARLLSLPETERSALWLADVAHLDATETAQVLAVDEQRAAALVEQSRERLGDHSDEAGAALIVLAAALPPDHANHAASAWRAWLRGKHLATGTTAPSLEVAPPPWARLRLPKMNLLRGAVVAMLVAVIGAALLLNQNRGHGDARSPATALSDGSRRPTGGTIRTDARDPSNAGTGNGEVAATPAADGTGSSPAPEARPVSSKGQPRGQLDTGGAALPASLVASAAVGAQAGPSLSTVAAALTTATRPSLVPVPGPSVPPTVAPLTSTVPSPVTPPTRPPPTTAPSKSPPPTVPPPPPPPPPATTTTTVPPETTTTLPPDTTTTTAPPDTTTTVPPDTTTTLPPDTTTTTAPADTTTIPPAGP